LENISEPFTTSRAADLLGFRSRTYFCEFFHKQTGRTFVAWRKECRLEQAKHLLSEYPWLTITDVAAASGLDASSFARIFRKHVGVAPRNFREQANESRASRHDDSDTYKKKGPKVADALLPRSDLWAQDNRTFVRKKGRN
jgi:AraC-like DNA-binding protein